MNITSQSESLRISPAEAQSFLDNNNFQFQRSLRPAHIAALVSAMKNGDFPPGTPICFVKTPAYLKLVDGQHRLRAQIEAQIEIDYTVITLITDKDAAASSLYTQFDIGAKRSIADRMKALNLESHINLPTKQANLLAAGAPYLKYRFGKISSSQVTQITPLQRLEIIKEFEVGAILFFECMKPAENWILKAFMRPHFVALGAYLCQYAPKQAQDFWTAIASNTLGGTTDPRSHMFNLAQNVETKTIALRRAVVISQAFIRGWNAIIEGKPLTTKLTPATQPSEHVRILGTSDNAAFPTETQADEKSPEKFVGEFMEKLAKQFPQLDENTAR